jgi:hypothetical protein
MDCGEFVLAMRALVARPLLTGPRNPLQSQAKGVKGLNPTPADLGAPCAARSDLKGVIGPLVMGLAASSSQD